MGSCTGATGTALCTRRLFGDGPVVHLPWHHAQTTELSLHPRHPGHLEYADDRHDRRTKGALGRRRSRTDGRFGRLQREGRLADAARHRAGQFDLEFSGLLQGELYVGLASFQGCPQEFGRIVRLNAATGALQAALNFKSIVPAKCHGPGAWSSPASTQAEDAVIIGTSNDICNRSYQDAIVRLNASTLHITSIWQVPPSQHPPDSDFGASPMLFSAKIGGVNRQLVGAVNKNGTYYADRSDLAAGPGGSTPRRRRRHSRVRPVGTSTPSSGWAGPGHRSWWLASPRRVKVHRHTGRIKPVQRASGVANTPARQCRRRAYRGTGHRRRGNRSNGRPAIEFHRASPLLIHRATQPPPPKGVGWAHPPASSGASDHCGQQLYIANQDESLRSSRRRLWYPVEIRGASDIEATSTTRCGRN